MPKPRKSGKSESGLSAETPYADIPKYKKRKAPTGIASKTAAEINDLLSKEEMAIEVLLQLGNIDKDRMGPARAAKIWASLDKADRLEIAKQRSTLSREEKEFMKDVLKEEAKALKAKSKADPLRRKMELAAYKAAKKQHLQQGVSEDDFDAEPMGRAAASKYKSMADSEAEDRKAAREKARLKEQPQLGTYIDIRWGPDWYTGTVLCVFPNPDNPEKQRMLVHYDSDNTWYFHDLPLQLGNEWRLSAITPDKIVKEFIDPDGEGTYRVNYLTCEVKVWPPGYSPPPLTDGSESSRSSPRFS